jgi:hypothetical protein
MDPDHSESISSGTHLACAHCDSAPESGVAVWMAHMRAINCAHKCVLWPALETIYDSDVILHTARHRAASVRTLSVTP